MDTLPLVCSMQRRGQFHVPSEGRLVTAVVGHDDFVAAYAVALVAEEAVNALHGLADELVTRRMAVQIVDLLEAVEIEEGHA